MNTSDISKEEISKIEETELLTVVSPLFELSEKHKDYYYFIDTETLEEFSNDNDYYVLQLTVDNNGKITSHFNSLKINDYCFKNINNKNYMILFDTNFNFNKASTHWTIAKKN